MAERKRDWEVVTGWEKRIKVDFGSIGPNHVRWSDWTYKERDIVARKVHESTQIGDQHGPRSKAMQDWAAENAPVMIDFARDGKPMPDWAHAEYRESGVPEYVKIVWDQPDPAGMGKWVYDPPGPWADKGDEPAWSARPMEKGYDPDLGTKAGPKGPKGAKGTPGEGFTHHDLAWVDDQLLFPISDIVYPAGKDELLCMVESRDPTRGGWGTMSALEAMGSGLASTRTETVRNATLIRFVVPLSYNIQDHPTAAFKLYFRKSNGGAQRPDYLTYEMAVPPKPKELEVKGPVGLPQSGGMHSKYGGTITYRTAANGDHIANDGTVISTAESRAKEDVPDWRKFEIGRLEEVDGIILPGPNALPQDEERYGGNRQFSKLHKVEQPQQNPRPNPDRIMPDDPNWTPVEKALSWAKETRHGPEHQMRWNRVAAALGASNGFSPMPLAEATQHWEGFNRNARWTMAVNAMTLAASTITTTASSRDPIEDANRYRASVGMPPVEKSQADKLREALVKTDERPDVEVKEFDPTLGVFVNVRMTEAQKREKDMEFYRNGPSMQGHFTAVEWERMHGIPPTVVLVEKWNRLAIYDDAVRQPNYWLEGDGKPVQTWMHVNGDWVKLSDAGAVLTESEKPVANIPTVFSSPPPGEDDGVQWDGVIEPPAGHKNVPVPDAMAEAIAAGDWSTVARLALEQMR